MNMVELRFNGKRAMINPMQIQTLTETADGETLIHFAGEETSSRFEEDLTTVCDLVNRAFGKI